MRNSASTTSSLPLATNVSDGSARGSTAASTNSSTAKSMSKRSKVNLTLTGAKRAIVASTTVAAAAAAMVLSPALTLQASAQEYSWPGTSSVCVGSGAGTGFVMTIGVYADNALNATQLGEEVYWRPLLQVYDPRTGTTSWKQVDEWKHYTLRENGAASSGLIRWNANGTLMVLVGGTTAPGVWTVPVTLFVGSGVWAKPYVEAWTAGGGYMTHAVPIDANSVDTDPSYGCYYR